MIYNWGAGLDFYGDLARFAVVAGVPFGNHTDNFGRARAKKGKDDYAWWFSYVQVPQACGRVSRGEQDENGNYLLNVACLADGSSMTGNAKRNYPDWFKDSIRVF